VRWRRNLPVAGIQQLRDAMGQNVLVLGCA
jgi:hypothetical protein